MLSMGGTVDPGRLSSASTPARCAKVLYQSSVDINVNTDAMATYRLLTGYVHVPSHRRVEDVWRQPPTGHEGHGLDPALEVATFATAKRIVVTWAARTTCRRAGGGGVGWWY